MPGHPEPISVPCQGRGAPSVPSFFQQSEVIPLIFLSVLFRTLPFSESISLEQEEQTVIRHVLRQFVDVWNQDNANGWFRRSAKPTPHNLAVRRIGPQDSVTDGASGRDYCLTGMLITIAPMTSLILKSRLGLS